MLLFKMFVQRDGNYNFSLAALVRATVDHMLKWALRKFHVAIFFYSWAISVNSVAKLNIAPYRKAGRAKLSKLPSERNGPLCDTIP